MKPHFHRALLHYSSVGFDKMQLKPKDAGKNGLSVYFLQVFYNLARKDKLHVVS